MKVLEEGYCVTETAFHQGTRWNLGCGQYKLPGYVNLDRKDGHEAYPLDCPDGSLDEIRASHVLEHFSHTEVGEVLRHWWLKLRPGGLLKVAVPDFYKVCQDYLGGKPTNIQGHIMGGHTDPDDRHGCIFDEEALREAMLEVGFQRIGRWKSDFHDCSSLPESLNLQGFKGSGSQRPKPGEVLALLSAPRYGPTAHFKCADRALAGLQIPYAVGHGAYWHQVLSEMIEAALLHDSCKWVMTLDYDTIFRQHDVLELYRLAHAIEGVDAIAPVQMKRGRPYALFSRKMPDGTDQLQIPTASLKQNLLPVATAHFGLTLFRAEALRNLPRPWFVGRPGTDGRYHDHSERVDPDVVFWLDWQKAGYSLFVAPRVVVGHMADVIIWPGKDLTAIYQTLADYDEDGIPPEVDR